MSPRTNSVNRKAWWIVTAIIGITALVFAALVLVLSIEMQPRTLRGPIGIIVGDAPKHGFLGVEFEKSETELAITNVMKGSSAAESGLRAGDVLIALNSARIVDYADVQRVMHDSTPNDEIKATIERNGRRFAVTVRLMSFEELVILQEQQRGDIRRP
jgi:S1-C subfamily serine protease